MAPHLRDNRGTFAGVGIITLAVIGTVIAFSVFLHQRCANVFWDERDLYPGAELIESESQFLGLQRAVYHSPDAPDVVSTWYQQRKAALMRDAVTSDDYTAAREPSLSPLVETDAERGGSLLTLAAYCSRSLSF